jgi:hypothetical protein
VAAAYVGGGLAAGAAVLALLWLVAWLHVDRWHKATVTSTLVAWVVSLILLHVLMPSYDSSRLQMPILLALLVVRFVLRIIWERSGAVPTA